MFSSFGLFKKVERYETEEKLNEKLENFNEKLKKYEKKSAEVVDLRNQISIGQKALKVLERKKRCMGRLQELRERTVSEQLKEFVSNTQQKINEVKSRAENLEEKVKKLATELRKCKDQMAMLKIGSAKNSVKQKATRILRQKKIYENQIDTLRAQSFNMEQANYTLQTLEVTRAAASAMKDGWSRVEKQLTKVNIEDVNKITDTLEKSCKVQEALMGRQCTTPEIDDDELDAELRALEDQED